jgi:transposase-like protein
MAQTLCPFCSFSRSWSVRGKKRKCKQCRREFSDRTYPAAGFRITKATWHVVIATFLRERTEKRIAEETGTSLKTAQKMAHYLRVIMTADAPPPFRGIVEMDETYIGGQRKNKKLHIRRIKGKRGHGTEKLPIVGLFSRESGQVYVELQSRKLDVSILFAIIERQMSKEGRLYTDGMKMYRGITERAFHHEYVDHDGGEYVRGDIHTNNIEGFWGILKRKMGCIGGMRKDRLHLFVGEIVWKFNHRKQSLKDRERALIELVLRR